MPDLISRTKLAQKALQAEIRVIKSCLSSLDPGLFWPVPTSYKELAKKMQITMPSLRELIRDNPDFAAIVKRILADNKMLSRENAHA